MKKATAILLISGRQTSWLFVGQGCTFLALTHIVLFIRIERQRT